MLKPFWYKVHVVSWNKKISKKTDKLAHVESVVVKCLKIKMM